jgi:hypothetical protein
MRDSISTWRTGMSSFCTSARISVILSRVSNTSRLLVRSSTVTEPRSVRKEFSLDLISAASSEALA